ncbi:ribose-5-phosphate isomerase RpiA [Taibaiella soli]|uniref:Ribose-5-phosphate isomerase A n=1 Tax=Taibaiella soli TaxID=1649169 RepID=A0A2W2AUJ4_9BACT|nr:ribose-5-phosphate isomerase RpiA [Taibaiella soli]PZF71644.1 ribose 5-phosphate isomerase A [Taibaiella soli]
MHNNPEKEKQLAAKEAVTLLKDGQIVGLGTGSTIFFAIEEIGTLVKNGLQIKGVATSDASYQQAIALGIPMLNINDVTRIDITIDGTDEFDDNLQLIKGGGGALFKEKIVASMSREKIIIADASKKVNALGKFKVPIEVVPFAVNYVRQQLKKLNGNGEVRMKDGQTFVTEQGNYIIDGDFGPINEPIILSRHLNEIEGILVHGLFVNMADSVIMGVHDTTVTFTREALA